MTDKLQRGTLVQRYVLPPAEIEARSLECVSQLTPELDSRPEAERLVVRRMVYACGDPSMATDAAIHPEAIAVGLEALRGGGPVVTDVRMVEAGLDRGRLRRLGAGVHCRIDDPAVIERAQSAGLPRAVVAMHSLAGILDGAVVVIGNAPTALLALLDLVDEGKARPALIIGIPVGFVAAVESKEELAARSCPFITVTGRRGGSAVAAAAMNALLRLAAA